MLRKLLVICLSLLMTTSLAIGQTRQVKALSTDDILIIKERLKDYFLELDTIDDGAKVETCYVSKAKTYYDKMQDDGSFADVDYTSIVNANNGRAWDPYLALDRLQAIAIAYHKDGNDLYHNDEVIVKLNKAMVHWNNVKCGKPDLNKNHPGPRSDNWWENQVGVQLRFSRIALFMDGIMSDEAMNIMLTKLKEKTPVKYGTGQNNLWFDQNWVYHAIITDDVNTLKDMVDNYLNYCLLTQTDDNTAEAVQVDNSFYMHGRQFYSNGYGLSMFRDMSFWIYMLRDTDYAISDEVMDRMANYMIEGTSWTLRGDIMELYLGYRPYNWEAGYKNYATAYIDPLKRMIASDQKHASQYQAILDSVSGVKTSNGKNGNYYMWRSGYASHMRDGYGVNIKMDSNTIIGGEWRGSWAGKEDQGQLVYWTSSAASTISVDGNEYINVFPVYDWAHCPGTTTASRIVKDYSNSGRFTNGTSHTIGVTYGKYGSTAYAMNKKDTQAKKGYFFFDDEFVALGAGITSKEKVAIHTTLNQCEAKGTQVNDQTVPLGTDKDYQAKYIYNDKVGYVFLDETTVHVSNVKKDKENASLWSEDKQQESHPVFKTYINHGITPKDESYAYIVVPNKSASDVKAYANNIPVTVVANTADVQAVRHDGLKQTQINFYKAGSLEYKPGHTVTVDHPCSLIIDESKDTRQISVAVNDQEDHQVVNVLIDNTKTTFVSKALPYAGQTSTLPEGSDNRYQASSYTEGHTPAMASDGDENTYWESQTNTDEWISFFTGSKQYIKSMDILWGDHYASEYDVYTSQDNKTYNKVQSITNATGNKQTVKIGEICQYVKIIMKSGPEANYQIKEVTFQPSQLLSQNKKVEVSSTSQKDTGNVKELAVDGDLSTRWSSNRDSDDEYLTVDLGKKAKLDAIEIYWQEACSDKYQIEISDDNENWTTIKSNLKTDRSLNDKIALDENIETRYVKVHSLQTRKVSGTNYGVSIKEFKVYGEYKRAEENIALNAYVETSSEYSSTKAPKRNITDGKDNTKWSSQRSDGPHDIIIDLDRKAEIDDITIHWGDARSDEYQIEVSEDNQTWKTVKTKLSAVTGKDSMDKISFEQSITARYVKLHSTKSRKVNGTNYGIDVNEIKIYGIFVEPERINLALNKNTETSSVSDYNAETKTFVGALAVDGKVEDKSRWASKRGENDNWITIDLGKKARLDEMIINWEGACSDNYQIDISDDNKNWTTVKDNLKTDNGLTDKIIFDKEVEGRYVKLHSLKSRSEKYGINIFEIKVYGEYAEEVVEKTNLALNKNTETSSVSDFNETTKTFVGALAVDGKVEDKSRWASKRGENDNWITIDLGKKARLDEIMINWEGACSDNYQIEISDDNKTWTTVKDSLKTDNSLTDKISFDKEVTGRYVKLHSLKSRLEIYGINIFEIMVYGEYVEDEGNNNLALNKPATASSVYNNNKYYVASRAFDGSIYANGDDQSRWVSNRNSNDEWIYVDLQDYYHISKIVLNWEGACGKEYKVQVSNDAKNWLDISHVTDGKAGIQEFNFDSSVARNKQEDVYGRYVRMQGIKPATKYGYSLWEFEVYGELITKSDVQSLYNTYNDQDLSLYTPLSVEKYNVALENVKQVVDKGDSSRQEMSEAIYALMSEKEALVKKADFTKLEELLDQASHVDEELYTEDSVNKLKEEVNAANVVVNDLNSTQEEVDKACEQLEKAINDLQIKVDRSQLEKAIEKVNQVDQTKYTSESIEELNKVLDAAKGVYEDKNATQEEVDQAIAQLEAAYAQLEKAVNKAELKNLIKEIENIDKDKYTAKSVKLFDEALEKANEVLAKEKVTQEDVDNAYNELKDAYDHLVLKVNKENLQSLLKEAESIDRKLYTEESLKALDLVLNEVKQVYENDEASESEVRDAIKSIQNALQDLQLKVDRSQLEKVLEKAKEIDETKYTSESIEELNKVLKNAQDVYEDKKATQEEVDKVCEQLEKVIKDLQIKVDRSQLEEAVKKVNQIDQTKYTPESLEKLNKVLKNAQDVYEDKKATQEEVDQVVKQLENSMKQLVEKADKKVLEDLIQEVESMDLNQYTKDSVENVKVILQKAKDIYGDENISQAEVDHIVKELQKAVSSLNKVLPKEEQEKPGITIDDDKKEEAKQENQVKTSDDYPLVSLYTMIALSALGYTYLRKKKIN